jgi:hypothetical protein
VREKRLVCRRRVAGSSSNEQTRPPNPPNNPPNTRYCLSTALGLFNKKVVGKKYGVFGKGAFPGEE